MLLSLPLERRSGVEEEDSITFGHHYHDYHHRRRNLPGGRRQLEHELLPLRSSFGTHFVHAHVGTPPQRVRLIVDTGSYTTAFPCVGCDKCRGGERQTSFWDPERSRTVAKLGCDDCRGLYR